jgi:hypothetical protein
VTVPTVTAGTIVDFTTASLAVRPALVIAVEDAENGILDLCVYLTRDDNPANELVVESDATNRQVSADGRLLFCSSTYAAVPEESTDPEVPTEPRTMGSWAEQPTPEA